MCHVVVLVFVGSVVVFVFVLRLPMVVALVQFLSVSTKYFPLVIAIICCCLLSG